MDLPRIGEGPINSPVYVCVCESTCVCYELFSELGPMNFLIFCMKVEKYRPQIVTEPDFPKKILFAVLGQNGPGVAVNFDSPKK